MTRVTYDRRAESSVTVPADAPRTRALLGDLSRLPEWLTMHVSWGGPVRPRRPVKGR